MEVERQAFTKPGTVFKADERRENRRGADLSDALRERKEVRIIIADRHLEELLSERRNTYGRMCVLVHINADKHCVSFFFWCHRTVVT